MFAACCIFVYIARTLTALLVTVLFLELIGLYHYIARTIALCDQVLSDRHAASHISRHKPLAQCCIDVGPVSVTVDQHQYNFVSKSHVG